MASISSGANGRRMIQFAGPDRRRRTIRLGKVTMKQAESVRLRVEQLAAAATTGFAPDLDTARWVAGLADELAEKLAAVGLIAARASSTLGPFLDGYFAGRKDVKPQTLFVWGQTRRNPIDHFGPVKPLRDINRGDADEWRLRLVGEGLADSTVRKRSGFAKQFFAFAVKKNLVPANPFADLKSAATGNPKRFAFVSREQVAAVLEACPDADWRLVVALARFGGLRCPSEPFALKWADVDWERGRMTVTSPKTEHHEGKDCRLTPIFPELRPFLEEARDRAEPGAEYVVGRLRGHSNLGVPFKKIIRRAGLVPWPKVFQNLRSTRQTELEEEFPSHVVCAWIGNSEAVARKHYLQVTDDHFARAAGGGAESGAAAVRNPVRQAAASSRTFPHQKRQTPAETGVMPLSAVACRSVQTGPVEDRGFEPLTSLHALHCPAGRRSARDRRRFMEFTSRIGFRKASQGDPKRREGSGSNEVKMLGRRCDEGLSGVNDPRRLGPALRATIPVRASREQVADDDDDGHVGQPGVAAGVAVERIIDGPAVAVRRVARELDVRQPQRTAAADRAAARRRRVACEGAGGDPGRDEEVEVPAVQGRGVVRDGEVGQRHRAGAVDRPPYASAVLPMSEEAAIVVVPGLWIAPPTTPCSRRGLPMKASACPGCRSPRRSMACRRRASSRRSSPSPPS